MFTGSLIPISVFSFYSFYCKQYEWYLFTVENSLSLLTFLVDVWFLLHLGSLFIYSKPVIYLFTFLGTFCSLKIPVMVASKHLLLSVILLFWKQP